MNVSQLMELFHFAHRYAVCLGQVSKLIVPENAIGFFYYDIEYIYQEGRWVKYNVLDDHNWYRKQSFLLRYDPKTKT